MSCRVCMRNLVELNEGVNNMQDNLYSIRSEFNDSVSSLVRCLDDDNKRLREELNSLQSKQLIRELLEEDRRQDQSTHLIKGLKKSIDDFLIERQAPLQCGPGKTPSEYTNNTSLVKKRHDRLFDKANNIDRENHVHEKAHVCSDKHEKAHACSDKHEKAHACSDKHEKVQKCTKKVAKKRESQRGVSEDRLLLYDQVPKPHPIETSTADTTYDADADADADADNDANETVILTSESHELGRRSHIYQKIRHIRTMLMRREEEIMAGQLVIDDEVCVFQETSSRLNF